MSANIIRQLKESKLSVTEMKDACTKPQTVKKILYIESNISFALFKTNFGRKQRDKNRTSVTDFTPHCVQFGAEAFGF
jgi:hypothetical protein